MRDLYICLRMWGSPEWVGGMVYIQNLAWAIASLPETKRKGIKLSAAVHFTHTKFVEPIRASVDRVYEERFFDKAYDKLAKIEVTGYGVTRAATVKPGPRLLRCP